MCRYAVRGELVAERGRPLVARHPRQELEKLLQLPHLDPLLEAHDRDRPAIEGLGELLGARRRDRLVRPHDAVLADPESQAAGGRHQRGQHAVGALDGALARGVPRLIEDELLPGERQLVDETAERESGVAT